MPAPVMNLHQIAPPQMYNYVHLFPNNPYPQPPPPIAHKVWILDCKTCGAFLTNRAMKAVLLLRPNVSLYSSDALPLNCSAYSSNPEALRPPSVQKAGSMSAPSRTCECLTQTLCCHGCGTAIGYMIVIPCARCTSSITASNRATNGHRFVFHSTEVAGSERHYIKDEPSVVPYEPPPALPTPYYTSYPIQEQTMTRSDFLRTPPLEYATPDLIALRNRNMESSSYLSRAQRPPTPQSPPPPFSGDPLSPRPSSSSGNPPPFVGSSTYHGDQKDSGITLQRLKPGDIVYWHHLSRCGEIPGVEDNRRARTANTAKAAGRMVFDR
ncbi:hypothetical protein CPB83DRAFT_906089 [Crepidotus variabilis]|uniref:Uncharacterized protein n=1 Tax=Crepidotus variabilis TaxID=179855 RepID=A0A9P6EI73_9AGAR|nr:hypothetical protein CPB83DRAFT_906089 [Crepidotus variabilis]